MFKIKCNLLRQANLFFPMQYGFFPNFLLTIFHKKLMNIFGIGYFNVCQRLDRSFISKLIVNIMIFLNYSSDKVSRPS